MSSDGRHSTEKPISLWSLVVAGVVVVAVLLLIAVIVVGLLRDQLDSTGVATVLCTLICSTVVGVVFKGKGGDEK